MSANAEAKYPDRYIIIPAAHNYVSTSATPGERFGGNTRLEPHLTAVRSKLAEVLNTQQKTTLVWDKAYNGNQVTKGLSELFQPDHTVETYNMFDRLHSDNADDAFDKRFQPESHDNPEQVIMVVTWCTNQLLAEFLKRKSLLPEETIDTVKDENFPPQNGKIYIIDNTKRTIQYI